MLEDITAKCRKAVFIMSVVHESGSESFVGAVWAVRKDYFLMPRHYLSTIRARREKGTYSGSALIRMSSVYMPDFKLHDLTVDDLMKANQVTCPDEDIALVKMVGNQATFDLTKFLISEDQLANITSGHVLYEFPRLKVSDPIRQEHTYFTRHDRVIPISATCPEEQFTVSRPLQVRVNTKSGDCGSMVFVDDWAALQCHRLIGFHVAGSDNYGYVVVPTVEMVEAMFDAIDGNTKPDVDDPSPLETATVVQGFDPDTHLGGCTIRPGWTLQKTLQSCAKSALTRTPMYNKVWQCSKVPALLKTIQCPRRGVVNPWRVAVSKYDSKPLPYVSKTELDVAAHIAFEPFRRLTPALNDSPNRVCYTRDLMTMEEAVTSSMKFPNLKPINRRTSPGFPWNAMGHTSKRKFFGEGNEYELSGPDYDKLMKVTEECEEQLKSGVRPMFVYTDSLKDELRSEEKVLAGETRLISGAPLHLVILTRRYFGAFLNAVIATRIDNGIAVGIDYVGEWTKLAGTLNSRGGRVFAGDYKAFDARCIPSIHNAILTQINHWYDDEHSKIRELLWLEITHSRHLCSNGGFSKDTIYEWTGSMPSGSCLTSILNSFYSLVLFVLSYRNAFNGRLDFWDHCFPVTFGDDNVVAVDTETAKEFNQITMNDLMARYGARYQIETKDTDTGLVPTRLVSEVNFLKRTFVYDDDKATWLCPLDRQTIRDITSYTIAKTVDSSLMSQLVDTCMREFSLHSEEVWSEDALLLYRKASSMGYHIALPPDQDAWRGVVLREGICRDPDVDPVA
jgi:hypothetical protein